MTRPLEGRAALVTGGGTRVGRAIAETLGRLGAHVAVHFHSSEQGAEEACAAIRVDGNKAVAVKADLAIEAQATALPLQAFEALGPVSILVNSAGVMGEPYGVDDLWKLNARAPYLLTQAFAERAPEGSDVINILDIAGIWNHWRDEIAYCMSKAAAAEATRLFALKLAPKIRVNGVAPGTVLPPKTLSPEAAERIKARIPFGRFGSAQDVADTVGLLLTAPAFVTGQIIAVDGGRSLA